MLTFHQALPKRRPRCDGSRKEPKEPDAKAMLHYFCRRCMIYDCELHGTDQPVPRWSYADCWATEEGARSKACKPVPKAAEAAAHADMFGGAEAADKVENPPLSPYSPPPCPHGTPQYPPGGRFANGTRVFVPVTNDSVPLLFTINATLGVFLFNIT